MRIIYNSNNLSLSRSLVQAGEACSQRSFPLVHTRVHPWPRFRTIPPMSSQLGLVSLDHLDPISLHRKSIPAMIQKMLPQNGPTKVLNLPREFRVVFPTHTHPPRAGTVVTFLADNRLQEHHQRIHYTSLRGLLLSRWVSVKT